MKKCTGMRWLLAVCLISSLPSLSIAAEIEVQAGTDSLSTALASASAGDVLELVTDGGVYHETGTVVIDKAVTIKTKLGLAVKPTLSSDNATLMIQIQDDLTLDGVVLDGSLGSSATTSGIRPPASGTNVKSGYDLRVNGCEFVNFEDAAGDGYAIYGEPATQADSVVITDCKFEHIAHQAIGFNSPTTQNMVNYIKVEDCTFWDLGSTAQSGYAVYVEATSLTASPQIEFLVDHVTIHDWSTGTGIAVYPKNIDGAVVRNSVMTKGGGVAVTIYGTSSVVENSLYDDCGAGIDLQGSALQSQLSKILEERDPWFSDPTNGGFKYGWSQLTRYATDKDQIGDRRWGRNASAPPRVAVNAIGPGTVTYSPVKDVYDTTDVVTFTATPNSGAELVRWFGDTLDASGQLVMKAHRYVAAQFVTSGTELIDVSGTFSKNVDWAAVAMELSGTEVKFEEVRHGEVLLSTGPDTLTVTTSSPLELVDNDQYLAVLSTKSFSHGHPHNTQVVDDVTGLGLTWTHVATQRGARNSTVLNVYKAQGTPTGDGLVSATLHNFPAGLVIALSVARYSGVSSIGDVISHNILGFSGPVVEITGYPRPDRRSITGAKPDNAAYSVMVPVSSSSSPVVAFIAHRNIFHDPGEGFIERDEFAVESGGNTNSISIVDKNVITGRSYEIAAGTDVISTALATASSNDTLILVTDGGTYHETGTIIVERPTVIRAAVDLETRPTLTSDNADRMIEIKDDLTLGGIIFDGSAGSSPTTTAIRTGPDSALVEWGYDLKVKGCEFNNFEDASGNGYAIYGDSWTMADAVLIGDCKFQHIGDEAIRFMDPNAHNTVNHIKVEDCTFWNVGAGIYVESTGLDADPPAEFVVDHVTVHDWDGGKAVYAKNVNGAVVRNSVTTKGGNVGIGISGTKAVVENSLYFDCGDGIGLEDGAMEAQLSNILADRDPWFADPAAGSFKYGWSQLTRYATDKGQIGDTRWGRNAAAPPRVAVNAIGPGTVTYSPVKDVYDTTDVVTFTATPGAGAAFVRWFGDTLDASGQIVMKAHRYVSAQFAPTDAELVDVNGTFSGIVDWSAVAMELIGTDIAQREIEHGEVLLATGPDTLTVTTSSPLMLVQDELYLAVLSTKSFSHGHPHNTQAVDEVTGLGLEWTHVVTQRGARNSTVLNIYKAQGTPSGDGYVSATMHNFPAGLCIALTVVRYSGVESVGNLIAHNALGFSGPVVEIIGYPRPDRRPIANPKPDNSAYSLLLPVSDSSNPIIAFIAHRNTGHEAAGPGFEVRDAFEVPFNGNTNSITLIDRNIIDLIVADEGKGLPRTFSLSQNYPNPFNPTTTISYAIPKSEQVTLEIYNILGSKVRTLVKGALPPGYYSTIWDGLDDRGSTVSGGVYLYRLRAGSFVETRKMVFVK